MTSAASSSSPAATVSLSRSPILKVSSQKSLKGIDSDLERLLSSDPELIDDCKAKSFHVESNAAAGPCYPWFSLPNAADSADETLNGRIKREAEDFVSGYSNLSQDQPKIVEHISAQTFVTERFFLLIHFFSRTGVEHSAAVAVDFISFLIEWEGNILLQQRCLPEMY